MLSNDILRSLRYTLKANNNDMVRILALADMESISANFDTWTTKEDEDGFVRCPDIILSGFLNGLIYHLRGKDDSIKRKRKAALATTIKIGSPMLYFTSLKPADSITVCICFMLMFLSAFSDSFIPEMACNAFISTFSISIVTFSCA